MQRPRSAAALLAAAFALVFAATLPPSGAGAGTVITRCLICGARGTADAILNVVLFAPLGAAASLVLRSRLRAVALGALVSMLVEVAQLGIPGRDPSVGDLLFNSLGALGGASLAWGAPEWWNPRPARADRLARVAAAAAVSVWILTGWLLQPSLPHSTYFGQWAPRLGHLEVYDGVVRGAQVGDVAVPAASRWPGPGLRTPLLRGEPVTVQAVAGAPPVALAPIFSIYDHKRREIVLLGADHDDLVFRYRTRAARLRLDQPDVRARGVLRRLEPGVPFEASVSRAAPRLRARLDGDDLGTLGFTLGEGWAVLVYPESAPVWLWALARIGWMAALTLPVGFWARRGGSSALAAAAVCVALLFVPYGFGLLPTPPAELAGAAGGWGAGAALARVCRAGWRRRADGGQPRRFRRAAPRRAGTHIA